MNKEDNRNMLLAIVLSGIVLIGWNYFYGVPEMQKQRQQAQTAQPAATGPSTPVPTDTSRQGGTPGVSATVPGQVPATDLSRDAALGQAQRVAISTAKIRGSISLTGGRIDDVSLKAYREQVEPTSANIVLLSPANGPNAYYADFGWVAGPGAATALPNALTRWTADQATLTAEKPVVLTWDNGQGLTFKRTITVDNNALFTVRDDVVNTTASAVNLFPYGLLARHGKPTTLGFYVLHEGLIGVLGEQGLQEYTYESVDKEPVLPGGSRGKVWKDASGGFIGMTDKYWATALIPDQAQRYEGRYSATMTGQKIYQADLLGSAVAIAPGSTGSSTVRLFAGAKEVATVDGYQSQLQITKFDRLIDWGWFYFLTKPLFKVMEWIYHVTGNFGIAILLVTILIKTLFFPLANKSYASMAKMKSAQPEMLAIRDRFPDDKMKQQQAMMELYKKEKINPLAGCWPVLIQIPVFFALYKVLFVTIEMRHAPFFGWVKDLAAPDPTSLFNLFGLLPFAVPAFLLIGVWPIIMGITMFVQMKLNPEPTDPTQKIIFTWMPLFFTFLLASFPAGLVIYWSWNNFLSILQQAFIMKKYGTKIELWDNLKSMFGKKPETKAN